MNGKNRENLLKSLIAILSVALVKEAQVQQFCNPAWRKNLKNWTIEVILKRLKFIISLCGLRTILYMYKRGFFNTHETIMRIIGQCIVNRGMQDLPRVQQLMLQYHAINDLQNMMEDDATDDLLLGCLSPNQDVFRTTDNLLLTDTPMTSNIIRTTDASAITEMGGINPSSEILRSHTQPRQDNSHFYNPPTQSQTFTVTTEVGVDVTDDIVDEPIDMPAEQVTENATSSSSNIPNPHYYVGYIADDIPDRIRPTIVDTTVGFDVAGNYLPNNVGFVNYAPSTSNQTGGGGGGGGCTRINHNIEDNSDTDTPPGTDDDESI